MFEDDIPDADTPDGFDVDKVLERWSEIEEHGNALGRETENAPESNGGRP